jgi:hypothetical protein
MKLTKAIVSVAVISVMAVSYVTWSQRVSKPPQHYSSHSQVGQASKHREVAKSLVLESITNPDIHWEERVHAVNQLPVNLDAATRKGLVDYLTNKPNKEPLKDWYVVANEVMQTLRQHELPPGFYTREMTILIESPTADPVLRDYAVQHLSQWISGVVPAARETDAVLVTAAFDAMCGQAVAAENGQLTLVGTTLNALADALLRGEGTILAKRSHLQKIALKLATTADTSVSTFNRACALQAAARLDTPELPDVCRQLVHHSDVAPDLRLGSVAALGLVGNAGDLALLQSFAVDSPFHYAAAAAIQRIQDRVASR